MYGSLENWKIGLAILVVLGFWLGIIIFLTWLF